MGIADQDKDRLVQKGPTVCDIGRHLQIVEDEVTVLTPGNKSVVGLPHYFYK